MQFTRQFRNRNTDSRLGEATSVCALYIYCTKAVQGPWLEYKYNCICICTVFALARPEFVSTVHLSKITVRALHLYRCMYHASGELQV